MTLQQTSNAAPNRSFVDATVASLPPGADDATKATASAKVNAAISEITGLLNAATTSVKPPIKRDVESVEKRQGVDEAAVVALIGLLLLELSGTLSAVIAALGLSKCSRANASSRITANPLQASLLSVLQPLLLGLSGLVLALALVIDGLLLLLGTLLTGILTGLSVALAGLAL